MDISLNTDIINALDVSRCNSREKTFYTPCGEIGNMPYGSNHYRLLCYLSSLFDGVLFGDIGTSGGDSAMALAYNPNNRVMSFDIVRHVYVTVPNAQFIVGNFWDYKNELLKATGILYDIPHRADRNEFGEWCNWLLESNYQGFLLLDDYLYDPIKKSQWESLDRRFNKMDVTPYGHSTGTGLVNFSTQIEFKLE